jgi:hypothetical protein
MATIAGVRARRFEGWLRTRLRNNATLRAFRARFSAAAGREARDDQQLRLLLASTTPTIEEITVRAERLDDSLPGATDGQGPFDLAEFERIFDRGDRWNFVAHA